MKLFESHRNDEMIEIKVFDGFFTNYHGKARIKNKKEMAQLKEDLENKGIDTNNLFV